MNPDNSTLTIDTVGWVTRGGHPNCKMFYLQHSGHIYKYREAG